MKNTSIRLIFNSCNTLLKHNVQYFLHSFVTIPCIKSHVDVYYWIVKHQCVGWSIAKNVTGVRTHYSHMHNINTLRKYGKGHIPQQYERIVIWTKTELFKQWGGPQVNNWRVIDGSWKHKQLKAFVFITLGVAADTQKEDSDWFSELWEGKMTQSDYRWTFNR